MYKLYCRVFQMGLKLASNFLPWRVPELLEGNNSVNKLPALIKSKSIGKVLIVTDKGISTLGILWSSS